MQPPPGPGDGDDPGTFVVIGPDPRQSIPDFDTEGDLDDVVEPANSALFDWVAEAFASAYEGRYLRWLASQLGSVPDTSGTSGRGGGLDSSEVRPGGVSDYASDADQQHLTSRLPSLPVPVRGEGQDEAEEVVFDGDLLVQLIEFYMLDGWAAVEAIGSALDEKLAKLPDTSGGGVVLSPWPAAAWLFRIARNALGLLVREELVAIETAAGLRLASQIAETQTRFAVLDGDLAFETVFEAVGKSVRSRPRLKDRDLADTLHQALSEAVLCRRAVDLELAQLARFEEYVRPYSDPSQGQRYGGGLAREIKLIREQNEAAVRRARALAEVSLTQLQLNAPLALLVLNSLDSGFSQQEMEQLLDQTLTLLRTELEELQGTVRAKVPHAAAVSGSLDLSRPAVWPALDEAELAPPAGGLEASLLDAAVDSLAGGDASWFPLTSERTLHELIGDGVVQRDSFTYVVYAQYAMALGDRLEVAAAEEAAVKEFWAQFSRWAAAASLAALVTPTTWAAAPALRTAAWVADLVLLARTVHSVTQELARLGRLRGLRLAEAKGATIEWFGELGELIAIRQDLLDGLAEEVIIALLTTIGGAASALIRHTLVAYGYYQDLETLLAD